MLKRLIPTLLAVLVTFALTSIFEPLSLLKTLAQQGSCRTFPETGRVVCGHFLAFWQENGGLSIFGYPITNEFTVFLDTYNGVPPSATGPYTVQYFERAALQTFTGRGASPRVQLVLVGTTAYKANYPKGNIEADLPLYPKSENLNVQESPGYVRTFKFESVDNPQNIFSFYKNIMLKQGWHLVRETAQSLTLEYTFNDNPSFDGYFQAYRLSITTSQIRGGKTQAEVNFTRQFRQ